MCCIRILKCFLTVKTYIVKVTCKDEIPLSGSEVEIFGLAVIRKYDTNGSKYTNRVLWMDITISAFSEFIIYWHL